MIDYKKLLKPYEKDSLDALQHWIQIDSTYDETTISLDHPFGQGVGKALEYIAQMGEKEGFEVDRCDGYATEISFGKGPLISIYAHADVVPVTGKWDYPPFGGVIENDIMYGRGTSDDKGPAMAAFYALKALKDNHLIDGYRVSLVIGGNEESGSRCLEHYFHVLKKPYPLYGFTPDGDFPLIYGEKGISNYYHEMDIDIKNVTSINGGLVANSVIDEVHCLMKHDANLGSAAATFFKLSQATYQIIPHGDEDELIIYGKSAHGSTPQFGVNAGLHLLKFLGWYQNNEHLSDLADSYLETTGKKLNAYYESENLHNSTYNVGLISYANHHLKLVVNFRYPENCDPHQVEEKLNLLGKGKITFLEYGEPLYMNPNSKMIQTLLHVYQDETKDYSTPMMTIGGGTYAKESKNTIAFGSAFPSRNDKIHSPNEEIHLVDFLSSQSIYARAINELGKLK